MLFHFTVSILTPLTRMVMMHRLKKKGFKKILDYTSHDIDAMSLYRTSHFYSPKNKKVLGYLCYWRDLKKSGFLLFSLFLLLFMNLITIFNIIHRFHCIISATF